MPLTDKQKVNIEKFDNNTTLEILDICTEKLGLMSVEHYCKLEGLTRRQFYYDKSKILRNMVDPELGYHILMCALKKYDYNKQKQQTLFDL